ncbi:hypothetical protein [uncultured Clostridium sp.]|uniref:hypothetical protein n=1 Tax=uncultured Clostridium sp. TaxID=59620 RepID=UPI0026080110|nr:hypothetical protein [uncultured Clostridium sp.]
MGMQVNIIPNIANNGSGMPTTSVELDVDISGIMDILKKYNLLLKTKMIVNSINVLTGLQEQNIYEFAEIYKNVDTMTIKISAIVWGDINDASAIECEAEGIFINR